MAAKPIAPTLKREQLVRLTVGLLEKKGQPMAQELMRRVERQQPLEVRGMRVEVDILEEALEAYAAAASALPATSSTSSSATVAPSTTTEVSRATLPTVEALPSGIASSSPQSKPRPGARWMPGASSASLLASRAQMECEGAETFNCMVRVVGGSKVPVLSKPDITSELTGEILGESDRVEIVARFVCRRDGRVYLRLRKDKSSWVSTRAKQELAKVVVEAIDTTALPHPLEPKEFSEELGSKAFELLPELDLSAFSPSRPSVALPAEAPPPLSIEDAGQASDEEIFEEEDSVEENADDEELDDEGGGECEVGEEEDEDEEELDASQEVPCIAGGSPAKHPTKRTRLFRVVVGRCPVLRFPRASELMGCGHQAFMKMKQEFWADAAVMVAAEGRCYLRLTGHRGWVCERSRTDLRRCAVVPATRRKKPISKKMARVIAFRGGDADGATKLRKEDLVKNKNGKIVSKRASEAAKKRFKENGNVGKWMDVVKRAKTELGLTGFVAVKKGTPVYERARQYFETTKKE